MRLKFYNKLLIISWLENKICAEHTEFQSDSAT